VLDQHQTRSYDQAVAILDELMALDKVQEVEDWEKMQRIADHYKYPDGLREYDGATGSFAFPVKQA